MKRLSIFNRGGDEPAAAGSGRAPATRGGWCLAALLLGAVAAMAAEDEAADPFGEAKPQPKPAAKKAAKDEEPEIPLRKETNPVVLAIKESDPKTAPELMFAVKTLVDIGRTDDAKTYLKKLIDLKPDQKTLAALHREHHSILFYQMMRDHRLKPEGEQFGKAVLDAAYATAHDPARLKQLVKQLSDPLPGVRARAIDELSAVETDALPPILEALRDPKRAEEHRTIKAGLLRMGPAVQDVLPCVLDATDDGLRLQVMDVLGLGRNAKAIPYLVGLTARSETPAPVRAAANRALTQIAGKAPTPDEMERFLFRRAQAHYDGVAPDALDYEDKVTLWHWDAKENRPVQRRYPSADAALIVASRLAGDLYRLKPDKLDYRRLCLAASLHTAKVEEGLGRRIPKDHPAYKAAVATGGPALEDVLAWALERRRPIAATGIVEILGDIGTVELLRSPDGRPRTLALALRDGDRRLQYTAAMAILRLDPQQGYAGSSYLVETLGYLISTVGSQRVLVAHPRVERSQSLIGMLSQIGLDADAVQTGNDAFRQATQHADYEFLLLSDGIDRPGMNETIQMLRRDPRTRRLPIGLMAREENIRRGEDVAAVNPLCISLPRPHDVQSLAFLAGRLRELAGRELVPYDERLDQAAAAMDQFVRLAEKPEVYGFYDFNRHLEAVRTAMFTSQLAEKAARVLGLLGTPEAQRALVTMASQPARPLELRSAAAKGFHVAVERRGLLLTRDEILQQYDRYNRSATLDKGTQEVLGTILDGIELPSRKAQEKNDAATEPEKPPTPPRGAEDKAKTDAPKFETRNPKSETNSKAQPPRP